MGKAPKKKRIKKTVTAPESIPEPAVPVKRTSPTWIGSVLLHLALIALLGLLAYSNTFNVPFQFDDRSSIVENPAIKDMRYFIHPSEARGFMSFGQYSALKQRYIGYLSFALNYKIHGLDVVGYHITNLIIHIINAVLVYLLVVQTFRTPFLESSLLREYSGHVAFFSALLFVSHPIQTQAVTYVAQRLASLATMFYLLTLVLYIRSRLSTGGKVRCLLYGLSLVSAILGMNTKQTVFTLPVAVALYEFLFFMGGVKRRALYLVPLFLTMLIVPLNLVGADKPLGELIGDMGEATRLITDMSRWDYLSTQFRVICTYIRLLVLPVNQNLDYDYPACHSFFEPPVFLSFLFLFAFFGLGVYLYYRSRIAHHGLRLCAFGIFWFFLALSVESSVIPIVDVIFEHRVYLPLAGGATATATGAFFLFARLESKAMRAVLIALLVVVLVIFSAASYARNNVWQSEISLWQDVIGKSPQKARGHNNLGNAYRAKGLFDKAIEHCRVALRLKPVYPSAHNNLGTAYYDKGLTEKALKHYQIALRLKPDYAGAHYNLGVVYESKDLLDKAIEHYQIALRLKPDYADAHINLGVVYKSKGLIDKAIEHYQIALRLKPDYAKAYNNLGNAYQSKGLFDKAIEYYNAALRLKPDYAKAYNNLGNAYQSKGLFDKAIEYYNAALRLKPDYADAHYNLGLVYLEGGHTDKARGKFQTALKINPDFHEARWQLDSITNPDKAPLNNKNRH